MASLKKPTLKECLAMVIWRIKALGYTEAQFESIDKDIAKSSNYERFHNTIYTERYGKKYSWIAFFELFGQFILEGLYESDYGSLLRTSQVDIDPTFPKLPHKKQLITQCFLPEKGEKVQEWIINDTGNYLDMIYNFRFSGNDQEWVLLHGSISQKSSNNAMISIFVDALLVKNQYVDKLTDYLENHWFTHEASSYYYLFSGEIAWSNNLVQEEKTITYESDKQEIELVFPHSMYSWESYHSEMNDVGNIPFICRAIFTELGLIFNVKEQRYNTTAGELVAQLIQDDFSRYLYIRKDFLIDYLKKYGLSLVWYEYGTRNGPLRRDAQKLNPPLVDFRYTEVMH